MFGSKKSFIEEKVYREKLVSGHIRNALVQLGAVASVWIARVKGVGNTARNACLTITSHQTPTLWPTRMGHPDTLAKTVNATPQVSTPVNVNEHSQTSMSPRKLWTIEIKILPPACNGSKISMWKKFHSRLRYYEFTQRKTADGFCFGCISNLCSHHEKLGCSKIAE